MPYVFIIMVALMIFPNELLELYISDQLCFEMLLLEIRGKTISYAFFFKARKRNGTTTRK